MARVVARTNGCLVLATALLLSGCTFPTVHLSVTPPHLTVLTGGRGSVWVVADDPHCDPADPLPCVDTTGRVYNYVVQNVPPGVTYSIDTSLQSPATPGVVRITFEVGASAAPRNYYPIVVHAVLEGRTLDSAVVPLHIVRSAPTATTHEAVAIAAGDTHSLAALADGSVLEWGLRDGSRLGGRGRTIQNVPTVVQNLDGIVDVAGGAEHSLALSANGRVWAWGANDEGQLGTGSVGNLSSGDDVPMQVQGVHNIQALAAGGDRSVALKTDATVWTWGAGPLGNGDRDGSAVPRQVEGLPRVRAIAALAKTTVVVGIDGSVWFWGLPLAGPSTSLPTPVQVAGLSNIRAVAGRGGVAFALDGDGRVWGWGANYAGQLGDGTLVDRAMPGQVQGLPRVTRIAAGTLSGAAVAEDGTVWEWGGWTSGPVAPAQVGHVTGVSRLAAGDLHTLALLECGQVWSWGFNDGGQLGTGLTSDGPANPTPLQGIGDDSGCDRVRLRVYQVGEQDVWRNWVGSDPDGLSLAGGALTGLFNRGATVNLSLTREFDRQSNFAFSGWSIDCGGSEPSTSIVLDRSKDCAARFENVSRRPLLLTVLNNGGYVGSDSGTIDCGDKCGAIFLEGDVVRLTALDAPGFTFTGWASACSGATRETTVTMTESQTCSARFRPYEIDVSVSGNGTITSDPTGLACPGACSFAPRAGVATLTATAAAGWLFQAWGGDCTGVATQAMVTVDGDKNCTATFVPIANVEPFPVAEFTFAQAPRVGQVVTFNGSFSHVFDPIAGTRDVLGIRSFAWDFDGDGVFEASGARSATAVAQYAFQTSGSHEVRLRVVGGPFDAIANTTQMLNVLDAEGPLFGLTVNKAGTGEGVISSEPPGLIGCGPGCTSAGPVRLEAATSVRLTARPVPGSGFFGWSGPGCSSTEETIQVTMNAAHTCTATFGLGEVTLTVVIDAPPGSLGRVFGLQPSTNTIDCRLNGPVCTQTFPIGTTVVVRPDDTSIELQRFAGWTGCSSIGGLFACTVTLNTSGTVTARFTQ